MSLVVSLQETSEGLSYGHGALLADDRDVYFTTPHFDGHPAVLIRLERIGVEDLLEAIVEAWLARVPKRLAKRYMETELSDGDTPPLR